MCQVIGFCMDLTLTQLYCLLIIVSIIVKVLCLKLYYYIYIYISFMQLSSTSCINVKYIEQEIELPMCFFLQVPAGQVCNLSQSSSPPLQLFFPEILHIITVKYLGQILLQCRHLGRMHIVENGEHNLLQALFAFITRARK